MRANKGRSDGCAVHTSIDRTNSRDQRPLLSPLLNNLLPVRPFRPVLDRDAGRRHTLACEIVERSARRPCVLTIQALAEFFRAVTRKGIVPTTTADTLVRDWMLLFPTAAADAAALDGALVAVEHGGFSFWDALLMATVEGAGCTAVISEDMADGATIGSATVRHPFAGDGLADAVLPLLSA